MSALSSVFVLVPAILQCWLGIILARRGLHRHFRFFFSYTVFAIVAAIAKFFATLRGYQAYFFVYWSTEALYAILGMLAILEIFPFVFKAFSWLTEFRLMVWSVSAVTIVISILQAIFIPPNHAGPVVALIYFFEIAVRYLQGGVFLLFVALVKFWQIEWRQYTSGVILGFAVLAAGYLVPGMLLSEFGKKFTQAFIWIPAVSYIVSVVIWLLSFIKPQPPDPLDTVRSPLTPEELVINIRRLTDSIKESWR